MVVIGFIMDVLFGDPRWLYHPIRLIGKLIEVLEKGIRFLLPKTPKGELAGGGILTLLVMGISTLIPFGILWVLNRYVPVAGFVLGCFWCWQLLAMKSLKSESMKVYAELIKGDLPSARTAVSMIVGRDTESLTKEGVTKAAVETIAENASDGVIAPLFYLAIGGPVLGFWYKSINTMDSMIGYKNDRYLCFGRIAAKLDDVVNWLPARLTALLMIAAAACQGRDVKGAVRVFKRDRFCHASPNSAQTEAVMAGALQIQLAGDAWYFGKKYEKPTIGDPIRNIEDEDIVRANNLLYGTGFLAAGLVGVAAILCYLVV